MGCRRVIEILENSGNLWLTATLDVTGEPGKAWPVAGDPLAKREDLMKACRLAEIVRELDDPSRFFERVLGDKEASNAVERLLEDPVLEALVACIVGGRAGDVCSRLRS